jgi:hypothetical protein
MYSMVSSRFSGLIGSGRIPLRVTLMAEHYGGDHTPPFSSSLTSSAHRHVVRIETGPYPTEAKGKSSRICCLTTKALRTQRVTERIA